jgi:hypothetical protein
MYTQPINYDACKYLKDKQYTVMTLETAYYVQPDSTHFSDVAIRNWMSTDMTTAMTKCASGSGNYYHAETPEEISKAINDMFWSINKLKLGT